jgi:hypothetical protein
VLEPLALPLAPADSDGDEDLVADAADPEADPVAIISQGQRRTKYRYRWKFQRS